MQALDGYNCCRAAQFCARTRMPGGQEPEIHVDESTCIESRYRSVTNMFREGNKSSTLTSSTLLQQGCNDKGETVIGGLDGNGQMANGTTTTTVRCEV